MSVPSELVAIITPLIKRGGKDECWPWLGKTLNKDRRGILWVRSRRKNVTAPRLAYEAFNGPVPDDAFVCHSCDNPNCVNPAHLWLGDAGANARDAAAKGRMYLQRHPERTPKVPNKNYANGARHGCAKLTAEQVREIRTRSSDYLTLAARFGVHPSSIHNVLSGKTWKKV